MAKLTLLFCFILFHSGNVSSYERPDAFIVKVYDERVRVLSPKSYDKRLAVIIENKTLSLLKGKIQTHLGEDLTFISVGPGKSQSINVKRIKTDRLFFIPLSPPLQKVELKIGNKPYEIPPR
jgi:hypothetical protein